MNLICKIIYNSKTPDKYVGIMRNHFNKKIKEAYNKIADIWNKERDWYIERKRLINHIYPYTLKI